MTCSPKVHFSRLDKYYTYRRQVSASDRLQYTTVLANARFSPQFTSVVSTCDATARRLRVIATKTFEAGDDVLDLGPPPAIRVLPY